MVTNLPKGHVSTEVNVVEMMVVASAEKLRVHMPTGMGKVKNHVQMRDRYAKPMELANTGKRLMRQEMETGQLEEAVHQERYVIQTESVLKVAGRTITH